MSILTAFINLDNRAKNTVPVVRDVKKDVGTKINKVGDSLEGFVDDLFSDSSVYSYIGNPNNPPDRILMGAEALEIKQVANIRSDIALNSSSPKACLYANDPMLTNACRECEDGWDVKDVVYIIGTVDRKEHKENILKNVWFVFGDCYAADNEVYEKMKKKVSTGVSSIAGEEWAETKELGCLNRVDPLGITYLRVRGMWGIQHPQKVFDYIINDSYNAFMLMKKERFLRFSSAEKGDISSDMIFNVKIKSPNNPAKKMNAILLQKSV